MIVNLTHINASNGMFWYAMDRLRSVNLKSVLILTNAKLVPLLRAELPGAHLMEVGKLKAALHIIKQRLWAGSDETVVTFTPHPLPFISSQTIAFYDDFPFAGGFGRFKRLLFSFAARTSRCRVGIINRSLALPFLEGCGVRKDCVFFDSAFPKIELQNRRSRSALCRTPIRVGLVGTDSRKKKYEDIFEATMASLLCDQIDFYVYGEENEYTSHLRREFEEIRITVISSDEVGLAAFFDKIDYLVSVSQSEGYGRPMGLAAVLGVPMFLLRSPVFLEFFSESASFFDHTADLLRHITDNCPPAVIGTRAPSESDQARSGFFD